MNAGEEGTGIVAAAMAAPCNAGDCHPPDLLFEDVSMVPPAVQERGMCVSKGDVRVGNPVAA